MKFSEEEIYLVSQDIAALVTRHQVDHKLLSLHIFFILKNGPSSLNFIVKTLRKINLKSYFSFLKIGVYFLGVIHLIKNFLFCRRNKGVKIYAKFYQNKNVIFKVNTIKHEKYLEKTINSLELKPVIIIEHFELDSKNYPDQYNNSFLLPLLFPKFTLELIYWKKFMLKNDTMKFVFVEGDNLQDKIIASHASINKKLFTYCLQWGVFGSNLKIGFRFMPYSFFLSWSEMWSSIYKSNFPLTNTKVIGYLSTLNTHNNLNKDIIYLTSSDLTPELYYFKSFLKLSYFFTDWKFRIRIHPSMGFQNKLQIEKMTKNIVNVEVSTIENLAEDLTHSSLACTYSSSASIEAAFMGIVVLSAKDLLDSRELNVSDFKLIKTCKNFQDLFHFFNRDDLLEYLYRLKSQKNNFILIHSTDYEAVNSLKYLLR